MAERIVSPGVFTKETDQSFLPRGISEIGAAIIGPTIKGPALVPTKVHSFSEFQEIFGSYTEESYIPFTVQEYLNNAGVMTITKLLYEDGYKLTNGALAIIAEGYTGTTADWVSSSWGSGSYTGTSASIVTHVLHPTIPVSTDGTDNVFESSVLTDNTSGSFTIKISGSYATDTSIPGYSAYLSTGHISSSAIDSENNYLTKVFGTSPKSVDYPVYVQYKNDTVDDIFKSSLGGLAQLTMSLAIIDNYQFTGTDYLAGSTPWITSQKVGTTAVNLFKFHTLSHGDVENWDVKVGIRDIRVPSEVSDPNEYGSFTVEVRRVNTANLPNSPFDSSDTDKAPEIVESFNGLNLDPNSRNYIARRIGTQYMTADSEGKILDNGTWPAISKYIRVEVTDGVSAGTNSETYIPFGFKALNSPIPDASGSSGNQNLEAVSYNTSQVVDSAFSKKNYFGFDYTNIQNLNYLSPLPTSGSNTGSNLDFYLGDMSQSSDAAFPSIAAPYTGSIQSQLDAGTMTSNVATSTRKYMVPFQGGFDGEKPNLPKLSGTNITSTNTFGFDCSTSTSTGTKAYRKAFATLGNTDYFDINMLITPGIIHRLHSAVTADAREMAEDRQDTFYVMDTNALTDTITQTITDVTPINSNYTATYFPWVRIIDPGKSIPMWVPPSVVVPGALSFNDAVSAPWYAPAGLNRGGLSSVINTYEKLTQSDRDDLYEARINPIANFPNEGIVIWGQKTLQDIPSALDRVNVRRLLITVKKFIASATRYLVFEPNDAATRNKFLAICNPYLESVRAQQGLTAFRVVMDASNNTPADIDMNILNGQIFLQPTRTAEFIVLDFNIQPTGASFPE